MTLLKLSVMVGTLFGTTPLSPASYQLAPKSPAHTPADKFAIEAVYQTVTTTASADGAFKTAYGSGFFVEHEGRLVFVTAGHNCVNDDGTLVDSIAVNRSDELYAADIVHSGEPTVDLCLLKVSKRLKPSSVYKLALEPFKKNTELISYGWAGGVRLVKLWHKTIEYVNVPNVNNKEFLAMKEATYRGCSGGPVMNPRSGNVAGVVVMTNREYAMATPASKVIEAIRKLKAGQWR